MAIEVAADTLGEEWKGHVVRISGENDTQGFLMKQDVLTHGHVRLLLSTGTKKDWRKKVQICSVGIVAANLSVLNSVIVKKGEEDIPGFTDSAVPCRLGP